VTTSGFRLVCGFSEREVAKELGVPHKQVAAQLDALRDELRADMGYTGEEQG